MLPEGYGWSSDLNNKVTVGKGYLAVTETTGLWACLSYMKLRSLPFVFAVSMLSLVLTGCASKVPLDGMDAELFAADAKACNGYRSGIQGKAAAAAQPLLGHDEKDVIATLGNPEVKELAGRSQKFFRYYLTPGSTCKQDQGAREAGPMLVLLVRFNSLNRVNEISIRTETGN